MMELSEQALNATLWWRHLQPDPDRRRPGDRAALARLRRCTTVVEAAVEPAALDLARRIGVKNGFDQRLDHALLTAIVLAHVRSEEDGRPVARMLGPVAPGEAARMSALRLARVLAAETFEEKLIAFRRVVALAERSINVRDLALALLDWSDRRRIQWAFAYHDAPPPADNELKAPQSDVGARP